MADLKKKLSKLKTREEMEYDDEFAEGPIMTKGYWKALQEAKRKKKLKDNNAVSK